MVEQLQHPWWPLLLPLPLRVRDKEIKSAVPLIEQLILTISWCVPLPVFTAKNKALINLQARQVWRIWWAKSCSTNCPCDVDCNFLNWKKKSKNWNFLVFFPHLSLTGKNTFTTCYSLHPTSIFFFVTRKERGTKKEHGTKKTWD